MPVNAFHYRDGALGFLKPASVQTDRLADLDVFTFQAKSRLKEVVIEPEAAVALAEAPSAAQHEWVAKIGQMPWTGVGAAALEAYRQARELKIEDGDIRFKLALLLYDGRYYQESLEVMKKLSDGGSEWRFIALVWQGHLLDLLGRRAEAVARYQEALKVPGSPSVGHSQYSLVINKQWVEERLNSPFERK